MRPRQQYLTELCYLSQFTKEKYSLHRCFLQRTGNNKIHTFLQKEENKELLKHGNSFTSHNILHINMVYSAFIKFHTLSNA